MQHQKLKSKPKEFCWLTQTSQQAKIIYLVPIYCLLLGGAIVSCGRSTPFSHWGENITKISEIQQKKEGFTTVYLQGKVGIRAPFLKAGAYKLQDATGEIWVITNQTVPNVGDEVVIKGQLQFQAIPVSGQELGEVYVQEEQQLEHKAGQPGQSSPTQGQVKS